MLWFETVRGNSTYRFAFVSWLLVLAWAVFIFFMSANTGDSLSGGEGIVSQIFQWLKDVQAGLVPPGVDVVNPVAHFCEYMVFGALLTNAWRTRLDLPWATWSAVVCASLYGISDEIHQIFVPGRTADPVDWLVDTCGAALGALILYAVLRYRAKRRALAVGSFNGE